jgi:cytochrome c biogenesis protein CcmG, thiol:disulfide interchange protein DsbE
LVIVVGVLVVAGVAGVVAALFASGGDSAGTSTRRVSTNGIAEIGSRAPDFTLPALAGKGTVHLSDYRGRPVILNFWASWCTPCRKEFPLLKQARRAHAADDLAVVGVTYEDIPSDSRAFVKKTRADWPNGIDQGAKIAKEQYGIRAVPQSFFIAPNGKIVDRVFGITSKAALQGPLRKLLRR